MTDLTGLEVTMGEVGSLPFRISPKNGNNSVAFLEQWVSENKELLDKLLLEHGAILFEGFTVEEGIEFQNIVQSFNPELSNQYRGTSPRRLIPGTEYVFSASELPPHYPIPHHLEMAFLPAPPRQLFFCCLEAPTSPGGETTLCDYRKLYNVIDSKIRDEFETKGVMYIRSYPRRKPLFSDPLLLKGWELVFDMTEKSEVERELKASKLNYHWKGKHGDHLIISNVEAAVERHPVTDDKIWFNHSNVFHWSMSGQEFSHIHARMGGLYYWIISWLAWLLLYILVLWKGPKNMAMHTSFGDGSEIPVSYLKHVRQKIYQNMIFNRWKKGDVLMIDNFRVSHGRQPYSGKRKVVVAWSKPQLKPSHSS